VHYQENSLAPNICRVTWMKFLSGWVNGWRQMPFAFSVVWREPKDHLSDCYICLTNITRIISKSKHTVKYPDFPFAMRPLLHSKELPVPKPPKNISAMTTLRLMMITDSKTWTLLIAIRHMKQAVVHFNPIYQHKEILKGFVRDSNFTKRNKLKSYVQTKRVESSPPSYWNMLLSQSPKWIKGIFLSRKLTGIFNDDCYVTKAIGHQHDPVG
jgi:hypothetical protein